MFFFFLYDKYKYNFDVYMMIYYEVCMNKKWRYNISLYCKNFLKYEIYIYVKYKIIIIRINLYDIYWIKIYIYIK